MNDRLREILKRNGVMTTVISSVLIAACLLIMLGGLVMWKQFQHQMDNAEGGEAFGLIFVAIIILGVIIIAEIVGAVLLVFGIVALSFGIYLLTSKNIEVASLKKKRGLLVTINVFVYILFIALAVVSISLLLSKQIFYGISALGLAALLMVVGIFQSKNIKEFSSIIKQTQEEENQVVQE